MSKSITLYLNEDTIEKLEAFSDATMRSKSQSADLLILHGIANYDVRAAAPKKVPSPKKATKANTKVKKPAPVKAPRVPAGTAKVRRGRPTKAEVAAREMAKAKAKVPAARKRGRPAKPKSAPAKAAA